MAISIVKAMEIPKNTPITLKDGPTAAVFKRVVSRGPGGQVEVADTKTSKKTREVSFRQIIAVDGKPVA